MSLNNYSSLFASEWRANALGRWRKLNPLTILEQQGLEGVWHSWVHDATIPVLVDEHFQTLVRGAPDDLQHLATRRVAPL